MQYRVVIVFIYIFILYDTKLVKKRLKNICKLIKFNKKFLRHISYRAKRLLLRELQFPFVIYCLILFLFMNFTIVSFITTKDNLNLLSYGRRHIK